VSGSANIFCPKCGAGGQQLDSYCRSCGEWLPDMRMAGRRRGRLRLRTPEERNRRMRVLEALSGLCALSAAVLIFAALRSASREPLLVFAADLCIVTCVFQVVTFVIGRGLQKRVEKGRDEHSHSVADGAPRLTPADSSQFVRPPSVTERTTELLEPRRVRRDGE
jgi:hypothetical protein